MNTLQAANDLANKYNETVKAKFLKFDEATLKLISAEEFFARVYENEDGVFVDFSMTSEEDVIFYDGYVPEGFEIEAYYSSTLVIYRAQ